MKLQEYINQTYYKGYAYSYPHKMAYRLFDNSLPLKEVWKEEKQENLFLYIHVPFCEMRCGFCNLFTIANPKSTLQNPFLEALFRQIDASVEQIPNLSFSNFALGGGTPTFLSAEELSLLFSKLKTSLQVNPTSINSAIEVSPKTITSEKIELLQSEKFFRISMGVQSFIEDEVKAMGRPQKLSEVERAITELKAAKFPLLNLDLIYGAENQTKQSWQYSLERMVEIAPEEVFLYPLYIRPLTGLGKQGKAWDDFRMHLYLQGRDYLLANGYEQLSMRQFKKISAPDFIHENYLSQEDGMLGLGVGARSYTKKIHYSADYAVGREGIKNIISDYNQRTLQDFSTIQYGFKLNLEEEKRRYLIKSFCENNGLLVKRYETIFSTSPFDDFPQLQELFELNLVEEKGKKITLNLKGRALEDVIGPWLYSMNVQNAIQSFELT